MANDIFTPYKVTPSLPSFYVNPRYYVAKISTPGKAYIKPRSKQYIRDVGDVVLGSWTKGTKQLRDTLREYNSSHLIGNPILSRLRGLELLIYRNSIEPYVKHGFTSEATGQMLMNSLTSFGYTLDTLANPVKSFLPVAGGGKPGDFLKSLGLIEDEYRQTYDWNVKTGNGIADFVINVVGEFLSDPVNLITFGGNLVLKSLASGNTNIIKTIAKVAPDDLIRPFEKVIRENLGTAARLYPNAAKDLAKLAVDDIVQDNSAIITHLKRLIHNRTLSETKLLKNMPAGKQQDAVKEFIDQLIKEQNVLTSKTFLHDLNTANQTKLYHVYKKIRGITHMAENVDKALFYIAAGTSPIGIAGQQLMKHGIPAIKDLAYKGLAKKMNTYKFDDYVNNKPAVVKEVVDYVLDRNRMFYTSEVYSLYDDLLKKYNISVEGLMTKYAKILESLPPSKRNSKEADALFIQYLVKVIPELAPALKGLSNKKLQEILQEAHQVNRDKFVSEASIAKDPALKTIRRTKRARRKEMIKLYDLVRAIKDGGVQVYAVKQELTAPSKRVKIPKKFYTMENNPYLDTFDPNLRAAYFDYLDRLASQEKRFRKYQQKHRYGLIELNDPAYVKAKKDVQDTRSVLKRMYYEYIGGTLSPEEKRVLIERSKQIRAAAKERSAIRVASVEANDLKKNPIVSRAARNADKALKETTEVANAVTKSLKAYFWLPTRENNAIIKFNNQLTKDIAVIKQKLSRAQHNLAHVKHKKKIPRLKREVAILKAQLEGLESSYRVTNEEIIDRISDALDRLEIYDGGDIDYNNNDTFNKALKYLLNPPKFNKRTLAEYKENLDMLTLNVSRLYWRIHGGSNGDALIRQLKQAPHLKAVIQDLYAILNKGVAQARPKFLHAISSTNSLYYLKLSELETLNRVKLNLNLIYSRNKKWRDAYLKPDSPARKQLSSIVGILRYSSDKEYASFANALEETLAYIDATDALNTALDSISIPFVEAENMDIKFLNYIKNTTQDRFYDILRNTKTASDIDPAEMAYSVMELLDDCYPDLWSKKEFLAMLEVALIDAFDKYQDAILAIGKYYKKIRPGVIFDERSVLQMNWMGYNAVDLIDALMQNNVPVESIKVAKEYISAVSGQFTELDKLEIQSLMSDNLALLKNARINGTEEDINNVLESLVNSDAISRQEDTLARAITNAWTFIRKENESMQVVDGKYYLPKMVYLKEKGKYDILKLKDKDREIPYVKSFKNILGYVTYNDIMETIPKELRFMNMYQYSMATGQLSYKKVIDNLVVQKYRIEPSMFPNLTDPIEYLTFYNKFADLNRAVRDDIVSKIYKKEYIVYIREALTQLFEANKDCIIAPINSSYWKYISARSLLTWDTLIKKGAFDDESVNLSVQYAELKKPIARRNYASKDIAIKDVNVLDPLYSIKTKLIKGQRVTSKEWERYLTDTSYEMLDAYHNLLYDEIKLLCKDAATTLHHRGVFSSYIDKSMEALRRLDPLISFGYNTNTVKDSLGSAFEKYKELLEMYGIKADTKMNDPKVMQLLRHERAQSLALTIRSFNSKQLRTYIDKNTGGMMLYVVRGEKLPWSTADLADAGLKIVELKDSNGIFMIWRLDDNITNNGYAYRRIQSIFREEQDVITDIIKANRNYYNFTNMDMPNSLFMGDMMNTHEYNIIINSDIVKKHITPTDEESMHELVDLFGDDIVSVVDETGVERKALSKYPNIYSNNFYKEDYSRPNMAFVGDDESAYNTILDYFSNALQDESFKPIQKSNRLDKAVYTGSTLAIKRVDKKQKMLQLFFNDDFYLGAPMFKRAFKNASDKEIQNFFSKGHYVACILRETKNGNPRVFDIGVRNHKQLQEAIELGAIAVPYDTYRSILFNVNDDLITDEMFQWYNRYIVSTFKTMYLSTIGWLMRNGLDSLIYKNAAATGGVGSIWDNFQYEYQAMQLLKDYNEVIRETFALSGGKTFNADNLVKVLNGLPVEKQLEFRLTNRFMNSSASAGMAKEFEKFYLARNMKDELLNGGKTFIDALNEDVMHNAFSPTTLINNANDIIEQSARYGLLLNLINNGTTFDDALTKIIKTHFDYKTKPTELELLEHVLWFSTFPISNFGFYVNGGLTDNLDLLKAQFDAMELSWNDGEEYVWDYVQHSNYLSNMAMSGNIRLNINDKNFVVKTGSSVFDFFKLIYDPVGSVIDRLNPFLSFVLGKESIETLNPFSSVGSRAKQVVEGTSYVPSVYGSLYPKYEFPKRRYSYQNYNPRYYHTYIPKTYISNPKYLRKLTYMFKTNRYYFGRGKNFRRWLSHSTVQSPVWYNSNFRRRRKFRNRKKRY